MADTKISALTALAAADVDTAADVLAIVDTSVTTTKKIVVDDLRTSMGPKLATEAASTSGTTVDFTSIPSWVKRITVMLVGVSTNGTSNLLLQLGDSGGVETSSYVSGAWQGGSGDTLATSTAGMIATAATTAATTLTGAVTLTLEDSSDNTWVATGTLLRSDGAGQLSGGSKALSATLDRVRLTTVNGTDTFDAGAVNLLLE
jgi:hypothetical protein